MQGRLIGYAPMHDGIPNSAERPAKLLAFIDRYKATFPALGRLALTMRASRRSHISWMANAPYIAAINCSAALSCGLVIKSTPQVMCRTHRLIRVARLASGSSRILQGAIRWNCVLPELDVLLGTK